MRRVYRLFGIEIFSVTYEGFDEEALISLGGCFEIAESEDEEEWEEEDASFGFRTQP